MSKDEEGGGGEALDPAVLLTELKSKTQTNKFLLLAVLMLFVINVCVVVTGYSVLFKKVGALQEASSVDVESFISDIHKQLEDMETYKEREVLSITELEDKIGLLRDDYQSDKIVAVKTIFLEREADFQQLLDTLLESTESLSAMVRGSRDWVEEHRAEMKKLKKRSITRSSAIQATMPVDVGDNPS